MSLSQGDVSLSPGADRTIRWSPTAAIIGAAVVSYEHAYEQLQPVEEPGDLLRAAQCHRGCPDIIPVRHCFFHVSAADGAGWSD